MSEEVPLDAFTQAVIELDDILADEVERVTGEGCGMCVKDDAIYICFGSIIHVTMMKKIAARLKELKCVKYTAMDYVIPIDGLDDQAAKNNTITFDSQSYTKLEIGLETKTGAISVLETISNVFKDICDVEAG